MAFSLQEKMGELISLYLAARDTPTKDAADALEDLTKELAVILPSAVKIIHDAAKSGDLDKPGPKHDQKIKDIEAVVTIEAISDLSQFFSGVSQAVVKAQEDLNEQSIEYVKHLPRQKDGQLIIPPSYFAIPNVKAEMKVGVSQVKGKGLNIIIFSKKEQRQNYSESTISFEVVTTPAPPNIEPEADSLLADATKPAALKPRLGGPTPFVLPPSGAMAEALSRGAEFDSPPEFDEFDSPPALADFGAVHDFSDVADFAERNAALIDRERALDLREDWLDVRARLLGKRPVLLGDRAVLDFIREELRERGKELGKLYDNTEDLALILSYTKQSRTGYLVLWPGRAETDRDETWRELRVFHLIRVGDALAFDTSLFETTPGEGFLLVTSRKDLLTLSPEEVADLSINLGDVLMKIVLVFNEWLTEE